MVRRGYTAKKIIGQTPRKSNSWNFWSNFAHNGGVFQGWKKKQIGVGSWPLGVEFSASRCHLFLSLGVDFGFLGVDFESLGTDFGDLGAHFGTLGVILALKGKCMLLSFDAMPLGVKYGPLGDNFWIPWVNCGPLGVNPGPLWFNLKPLGVGFESQE